jgi:L-ascorbate metabolism protein UlaG (beta-lactamase superfamily)
MTEQCAVTWWGHATVAIDMDGVRFVTDPVLRRWIGPLHWVGHQASRDEIERVDVVLLSHLHRDHTDVASLARLPARTRIVVPAGGSEVLVNRVRAGIEELDVGESTKVKDVTVRAVRADHDGRRVLGGQEAAAVGYLLSGSRRVYFAGDTELFDAMAEFPRLAGGRLDIALLPISGWGLTLGPGHMDTARAAEAVRLLNPHLALPVHWGTLRVPVLWRTRPKHGPGTAVAFAEHAARVAPTTRVVIAEPGRPIVIPETAQCHG